jgi:hypothetical protein
MSIVKPSLSAHEEIKRNISGLRDLSLPRFGKSIHIDEPKSPSSDIVIGDGSPMASPKTMKKHMSQISNDKYDDSSESENDNTVTFRMKYRTATANFGDI